MTEDEKIEKTDEIQGGDFKRIMSMSEFKGVNVHDFISKKLRKKLNEKYKDKIFFPILGIAFEEKKKFIFLFHESLESIDNDKVIIMKQENITEKELKKFFDYIKKNKKGD